MKGFTFGFIDNLIVAISAIFGIHIDTYFQGAGLNGALYGAIIGHTISDMIAGYKAEINNRWLIINDKQRKTMGYETNVFNNLEELSNWLDYGPREGS